MMRILVTGAGGPSAISVWKSLGDAHALHMADMDPCAAGLYLVPPAQRLLVPRGDAPQLVERVLHACRERRIDVLVPTVDAELVPLAQARDAFDDAGVRLALAPLECLLLCRDKHALLRALHDVVPLPRSEPLTPDVAAAARVFPAFAKPRRASGSRGAIVVRSRDDLSLLPHDGSYLLQELLPGAEYSVDVYVSGAGQVIAAVPRERMKTDSGIAVTARTVDAPDVIDAAVAAALAAGVRYAANIQFKRADDGTCKLLEINPRFPGTLPLTVAAGVNMPALLIADLRGDALPAQRLPFRELMVARYFTEQFFDVAEWRQLSAVTR
jgi:carbamoyl-phosphate synthase large subunit